MRLMDKLILTFMLLSSSVLFAQNQSQLNNTNQGNNLKQEDDDMNSALEDATPADEDFEEVEQEEVENQGASQNANVNANANAQENTKAVQNAQQTINQANQGEEETQEVQQENDFGEIPNEQTIENGQINVQNGNVSQTPNQVPAQVPEQTQSVEDTLDESVPATDPAPEMQTAPNVNAETNVMPQNSRDVPAPNVTTLPQPNEFSGAPPVPGTRREMAENEAPVEYVVQPGDTLFDICDQLLDEPYYWPKLWAHNPQIKNPHYIYPGMTLKFYMGDGEQPPFMEISEADQDLPPDTSDLEPAMLVAQEVPEVDESTYVDVTDDKSAPVLTGDQINTESVESMFLELGAIYSDPTVHLTIPSFIFGTQKESVGEVVGHKEGHSLSGPEDGVILKSEVGLTPGTTYTVLRPKEEVENSETGDFVGYFYYYVGNVKVDKALNTDNMYLGIAERANMERGIATGDILVPFISTRRTIPDVKSYGNLVTLEGASIIGFGETQGQYGGRGGFVFINRGTGQLAEGDAVKLYSAYGHDAMGVDRSHYPKKDDDSEFVGIARIINVTDVSALGYVMNSEREARLGDPVGK